MLYSCLLLNNIPLHGDTLCFLSVTSWWAFRLFLLLRCRDSCVQLLVWIMFLFSSPLGVGLMSQAAILCLTLRGAVRLHSKAAGLF